MRIEQIQGGASFDAWEHQIFNADVSESSTSHDLIVPAAGSVAVKILHGDGVFDEVGSCGRGFLNITCGGDVVGGDGIAENT